MDELTHPTRGKVDTVHPKTYMSYAEQRHNLPFCTGVKMQLCAAAEYNFALVDKK